MEKSNTFKGLIVWQKAHLLVLSIYKVIKNFPREEIYALTSQVRRASLSIAANIAEVSLEEVKYYIVLSKDLEYENTVSELDILVDKVGRLINGYSKSVSINKI